MDEIFRSRQEHDLFKFLAKDLKELGELVEGQAQAIKKVQEITGLIDGYFLESLTLIALFTPVMLTVNAGMTVFLLALVSLRCSSSLR